MVLPGIRSVENLRIGKSTRVTGLPKGPRDLIQLQGRTDALNRFFVKGTGFLFSLLPSVLRFSRH